MVKEGMLVFNKPMVVDLMLLFSLMLIITYAVSPKYVYGTTFEAIGKVKTFGQFKDEIGFCFMFFIGVHLARTTKPSRHTFLWIAVVLTALCIITFMHSVSTLTTLRKTDATTITVAYNFIAIIPVLSLSFRNHKFVTVALWSVAIGFVIWGAKRGAIVCMAIASLYFLFWYTRNFRLSGMQKIGLLIIVIAICVFATDQYVSNEYLQERISNTQRKGIGPREIGYAILWDHWLSKSDLLVMIFGNGTAQTITVWGNYGHNDWLELLIDNGLFGALLYLCILIFGIVFILKNARNPYIHLPAMLCMLIWISKTVFSMGYTDLFSGIMTFTLGFCIQKSRLDNKKHMRLHKA